MKKILLMSLSALALSSCSSYHAFMDKMYSSDESISINPDDTLENPDQDGENVTTVNPSATLKIVYVAKTNEIDANIITNWNDAPQGSIYLTWTAPKESNCYSTSFPITKYKEDQDYTKDSQSVMADDIVCKGKWSVSLVNKSDNSVLAKKTINIE
ncbi:TUL4 family lipoprotein [Francisella adeliensis]|uniref:17 kDa lipoprotein n=1 Tax=Francisella adeliensis TaxID=2007306 RepID=A0A2Z4XXF8_9GAMM|nr:TUL4 family lipoprotein [Francisella adeliensis]AXA33142.1 hypothetical protein CDH04_01330 [Francisella adeliensis]MBK2085966.1 hypothetical protein [Francisella adeliensis]MBK2096870.1 hypothetical protein [Francisella adeliensis]QIW11371.1 hypothetical protein FZC43_01330 [Francisella adeliensis]QIW13246.1 hypothetical protein FZC44_01330 [Francisella adeliensis]